MKTQPFKGAIASFMAINEAMAIQNLAARVAALTAIPAYRSRGKGRGTPSKFYGNRPGKYMPHQGAREMARRRRQAGLE